MRSIAVRSNANWATARRPGLEAGVRDTFAWYVGNAAWWQRVMDGSYRNWIEKNYAG